MPIPVYLPNIDYQKNMLFMKINKLDNAHDQKLLTYMSEL